LPADLATGLCLKYVLNTEIKNMKKKLTRIVQRKVLLSVLFENFKRLMCISKQCLAHLVEELDCIIIIIIIIIIMALQLFMQSFGLLNQFLPSSSILDMGLPVWHF
jgi:hypothetical protein